MMASEYKKRGGEYTTDEKHKDASAKHLDKWTEEEWQTKDGDGKAKNADGTESRYLPKKAWEQMSEEEKEETDKKKVEGSREGKQYVVNTSKAKEARKKVSDEGTSQKTDYKAAKNCTEHWEDEAHLEKNLAAYKTFKEQEKERKAASDQGKKRSHTAKSSSPNKKQKGASKDEPLGAAGSITRVPQTGQKAQWHSLPGYVSGEVVEVVYTEKQVDGKKVKASKEDPRIVLKSDTSGKICVHKPAAVYFE
jgi:hypothetical protein